ncbi:hypothetical protein MIDIC_20054 [Alphaproteobacteria bacterium]
MLVKCKNMIKYSSISVLPSCGTNVEESWGARQTNHTVLQPGQKGSRYSSVTTSLQKILQILLL